MELFKEHKKRKLFVFSFLGAFIATVTGLVLSQINPSLSFRAKGSGVSPYSLTLDSTNKVISNGDHVNKTAAGNDVVFTYSSVAGSTSGHVTLQNGGSLVNKDHIRSIEKFTCTFETSGSLTFATSYGGDVWTGETTMQSGYEYDVGSAPYYIRLKASGSAVTINSFVIGFTCVENPNAHEDYQGSTTSAYEKLKSADGYVGECLIVYEKTDTEAYVFDGSLSTLDATDNYQTLEIENETIVCNSTSSAYSFTIDAYGHILSSSGFYIGQASNANGLSSSDETQYTNTVSTNSSGIATIVSSGGAYLRFNSASDQMRFRYYKSSTYAQQGGIFIYARTASGPSYDAPESEIIGFTATDSKKDSYKTTDIFDNDNGLTVVANRIGGGTQVLTKGGHEGYSYVVKNSADMEINTAAEFGHTGNVNFASYTVIVSYKNFIPQEYIIRVEFVTKLVGISLNCEILTFNTSEKMSDYLDCVTANLTYNKTVLNEENVPYSDFADRGITLSLYNPNDVGHDLTSLFGIDGTWTLIATSNVDSTVLDTLEITVNAIQVATISVTSANDAVSLQEEDTLQLSVNIEPNDATHQNVTWTSSNTNVATVNANGLVTGVNQGSATITATATDDSGVTGTINLEVTPKPVLVEHTASMTSGTNCQDFTLSITGRENTVSAVKAGTSNKNGNMKITVGAGATKLSFYASGWSSGNNSIALSGANCTPSSIALKNESVFTGTATSFSLSSESNYYYEVALTNITSETTITVSGTGRFIIWDAKCYTAQVDPVYPTSIQLSGTHSISIGGTSQISVAYSPSDTNVMNATYTSNNTNVATVSASGLITGVAAGSTTITVSVEAANGTSIEQTFAITVNPVAVESVSLNKTTASIKAGKTVDLVATVNPSNATNKTVTWTSSNNLIASVNAGTVTGVAAGEAIITATAGGKSATCTVTVTASTGEESFSIDYLDLPTSYQTGSTVYTASSGVKFQAYNCANYSKSMQFKASSGYLQNTESLELQSLTINDRQSNSLIVYGSNTAGSFSTAINGENDVYDLSGYTYFKIAREASGAAYCSSITIVTGTPTPVDPTSIKIMPETVELAPGGTKDLSIEYTPSNANNNKAVTWSKYSGSNTISVDSNGRVTVASNATAGQSAVIRATLNSNSGIYATRTVSVVQQTGDDQTILIYMCGSDLESNGQTNSSNASGYATGDIKEILAVSGQPDDVNVVIETGGAKCWKNTYSISKDYLTRYHVNNKSLVKDSEITKASMGETSTLQSFITWGVQTYPADRISLILWNHGGAMRGVCYDENYSSNSLLNSEVKSALSNSFKTLGRSSSEKFEWIGYDACLMQVQDIAEFNSAYFNYMVASEESEAGAGWDYDTWIDDAYAKKSTETILTAIVDGFIADTNKDFANNGWGASDQTLSWLDLSYMATYKSAWEAMASKLSDLSINKSSFQSMAKTVKYYGSDDDCEGYSYFGIFDAKDFLNKLKSNYSGASSEITAALTAFADVVKYSNKGSGAGNSNGLCCFFPMKDGSGYNCSKSTYYTTSQTNFTNWRSIVNSYGD